MSLVVWYSEPLRSSSNLNWLDGIIMGCTRASSSQSWGQTSTCGGASWKTSSCQVTGRFCKNPGFLSFLHTLCGSVMWFFCEGGNTLLPGLPERLQAEVRGLVPSDMAVNVRVTSPKARDFLVWSGGAVLANSPSFSSAWISQEEYEEYGPQIVFRKCFWGRGFGGFWSKVQYLELLQGAWAASFKTFCVSCGDYSPLVLCGSWCRRVFRSKTQHPKIQTRRNVLVNVVCSYFLIFGDFWSFVFP